MTKVYKCKFCEEPCGTDHCITKRTNDLKFVEEWTPKTSISEQNVLELLKRYNEDHCSNCKVSLIGKPIPQEYLQYYGGATHYRREIGIEIPEIYDGIIEYNCPDCGHTWKAT